MGYYPAADDDPTKINPTIRILDPSMRVIPTVALLALFFPGLQTAHGQLSGELAADPIPTIENVSLLELDSEADILDFDAPYGHAGHRKRADHRGPAGVFGEHVHKRGQGMVEYKFMRMRMDGMRNSTTRLTPSQYFAQTTFNVMPTDMDMDMHMLHGMYGYTDNITLYTMLMWSSLTMDHVMRPAPNGPGFRTHNDGFDDIAFGALWRVWKGCNDELILNLGASVPTGNIGNIVPAGTPPAGQRFPYPMRLGSGTFNFRPGVTYLNRYDCGSLGVAFNADLAIGTNWSDYAEGNRYSVTAWYAHLLTDRLSLSYRVEGLFEENFRGADPALAGPSAVVPTARTDMQGGEWVNFHYGFNYLTCGGHRFSLEMGHPVYQRVDGFQLETDLFLAASWSKAF